MSQSRKKRRADGSLRPSVRRARARARLRKREEWLAKFEPGARDEFFEHADLRYAIWLKPFSNAVGLPQEEAWPSLEKIADERRYRKLRLADGMVVGIAPSKGVSATAVAEGRTAEPDGE